MPGPSLLLSCILLPAFLSATEQLATDEACMLQTPGLAADVHLLSKPARFSEIRQVGSEKNASETVEANATPTNATKEKATTEKAANATNSTKTAEANTPPTNATKEKATTQKAAKATDTTKSCACNTEGGCTSSAARNGGKEWCYIESMDQCQDAVKGNLGPWSEIACQGPKNTSHEIEFDVSHKGFAQRSKIILVVLEATFVPACFGADRCYMGQPILGVIKGLTLGGFTIWAIIDYIIVLLNSLNKKTYIDGMGFQAQFDESWVDLSYWVSVVMFSLTACWISVICCCGIKGGINSLHSKPSTMPPA